jgi:hypothetical protein
MRYQWGWLALLLLWVACSHAPQPTAGPEAEPSAVAVRIENHSWSDVVILISVQGVWERVGMAGAVKSTNFFIPWRKLAGGGPIRFQADPSNGTASAFTENLLLQPGKLVVWTLEQQLDRSSVAVY